MAFGLLKCWISLISWVKHIENIETEVINHQSMQPVFHIQDDPAPVDEVLIPILWLMHEGRENHGTMMEK